MIVQQINLYQDRFREKRLWISAMQVAAAFLVVVAVAAIWSFLLQSELGQAEQRNRQVKVDRDRIKAELTKVNLELAALLEDDRLDREIENSARQISARKKILNFVAANRFGSGQGFSSYLVALSNLKVDDIWLSKIRLGENYVHIKGSALSANQVPAYFDRFSSEDVFQGNRFDLFQLSRDSESDWKVDFEIATSGDFDD
jgi:lipopolysaccharide export LptBFGC system permease protein LptF